MARQTCFCARPCSASLDMEGKLGFRVRCCFHAEHRGSYVIIRIPVPLDTSTRTKQWQAFVDSLRLCYRSFKDLELGDRGASSPKYPASARCTGRTQSRARGSVTIRVGTVPVWRGFTPLRELYSTVLPALPTPPEA
jgi:hypothetical protein